MATIDPGIAPIPGPPTGEDPAKWLATALAAVRETGYTLEDLFEDRARTRGDEPYLAELGGTGGTISASPFASSWSFSRVRRRIREIAATFLKLAETSSSSPPRVALFLDNSVTGACSDLACLTHDILNTPLNVHFTEDQIAWILNRLRINTVVTDTEERARLLLKVARQTDRPFTLIKTQPGHVVEAGDALLLDEAQTHLEPADVDRLLDGRPRFGIDDVCTVMFTSGSTGRPKGVAFSQYNLISKRFARAAALPAVGQDELLLAYLPLFHTFGRYLELLGMLYWGGTYVFVGNPSPETLIQGLVQVRPTGLIGIPLRWGQIRDRIIRQMETTGQDAGTACRAVVGDRLRWGLSAAGYLEPQVFRFFQKQGVDLCSGFGMTEATGGITMSPPGEYIDDSVGKPLPAIDIRFTDQGEMQIRGHYVGRYLSESGTDTECDPHSADGWLTTGDIFKELEGGQLAIVDRVKDIYKNDRGQTVAPRKVERAFDGVPGIKRAFLVGDNRSYNVLLIVPDHDDPVLEPKEDHDAHQDYFRRIIAAANRNLAPYERVVNMAVLDRDFDVELGELTPKQTFRRKVIVEHFAELIEDLYRLPYVEFSLGKNLDESLRERLGETLDDKLDQTLDGDLGERFRQSLAEKLRENMGEKTLRVPRWFYRDLGVLEADLVLEGNTLIDSRNDRRLIIRWDSDRATVGELSYELPGNVLDLGLFARQPRLWLGNPSLAAFAPCKDGWDVDLRGVSTTVRLAAETAGRPSDTGALDPTGISVSSLKAHHRELQTLLYRPSETSLPALEALAETLPGLGDRFGAVARARIAALSRHPDEPVRCRAYRTLLLDDSMLDDDSVFTEFLDSGLSFLDEETIHAIASARIEPRRLESLRKRLARYRNRLQWPATKTVRNQFRHVLRLLAGFARHHPQFYRPVRMELASWSLLEEDPAISRFARQELEGLVRTFEGKLEAAATSLSSEERNRLLVFDPAVPAGPRIRLTHLFAETAFLQQAVLLAFEDREFGPSRIVDEGLWVSPIQSRPSNMLFRVGINTITGRHYDLLVALRDDLDAEAVLNTQFWMLRVGGHPLGPRSTPRFGCSRPEYAATAVEYVGDLTVAEKIREYSGTGNWLSLHPETADWRKLYVRAMVGVFRVWKHSGRRIVPGTIDPSNLVVPELDFRETAMVLSLSGYRRYDGPLCILGPLHSAFYRKTRALYPGCAQILDVAWIFDACREALGETEARAFLERTRDLLGEGETSVKYDDPHLGVSGVGGDGAGPHAALSSELMPALGTYLDTESAEPYVPLPLEAAVERFEDWHRLNPEATAEARAEQAESLIPLYGLDRFGEWARYRLFRDTYFVDAGDAVRTATDRLLEAMRADPNRLATQRVELLDLQAALGTTEDRNAFSRLVFPEARRPQRMEVVTYGESADRLVTVRTHLTDTRGATYDVREPLSPDEIGQLYRLFFRRHYPKRVSELDRYLIVADELGRVVAGVCYQLQSEDVTYMDGVVVTASLTGRGIATELMDDFCERQASRGVQVVKTGFFMRAFCEKRGFRIDKRWGGLVRVVGGGSGSSEDHTE